MKKLLAAAAFLAATACADAVSPLRPAKGSHDVDQNTTIASAMLVQNPCNDDIIPFLGSTHILIHSTTSTSGNQTFYLDLTSNWSGTGEPSQISYEGTQRDLTSFSTRDPLPFIFDFYQNLHVISATNADNFDQTIHFKITINANSDPTAVVDNAGAKCVG